MTLSETEQRLLNCVALLKQGQARGLLLLGHTDSATAAAGGLCVLTSHTQAAGKQKTGQSYNEPRV